MTSPLSKEGIAYYKSVLKGDLSSEALSWDCDYKRPAIIMCGHTLTPEQIKIMLEDHTENTMPYWLKESDEIYLVQCNAEKYPNIAEYLNEFYPLARKFPFLDIIFLSLANEETNLQWEWDLMIEKVRRMAQEEIDELSLSAFCWLAGFAYIKESVTVPETFNLLEEMEKHRLARTKLSSDCYAETTESEQIADSISLELAYSDNNFGVENFLYQPERLRKYMDIGLHLKDGTVSMITDPDEMLELLAKRLPAQKNTEIAV